MVKNVQSALAYIIIISVLGVIVLGILDFVKVPFDVSIINKVIEVLSGIILTTAGAKAGMAMPSQESKEPEEIAKDSK
jgi:hypothetical protein